MKNIGKSALGAFVILMLAVIFSGCSINKEKVCESASDSLEAILGCDSEELEENKEFSDDTLDYLDSLAEKQAVKSLTNLAIYEISDRSVKRDGGIVICEVELLIPDYKTGLEESDYKLDGFIDFIEEEEESDYLSIDLELQFDNDGKEYQLINGDDIIDQIYSDIASDLSHIADESDAVLACPIVYENDQVTIRFKGAVENGVHFLVRNNTDYNMSISADYLSVNRRGGNEMNNTFFNIDGRTDKEMVAECNIGACKNAGVFSGRFRINGERNLQPYYVDIEEVILDPNVEIEEPELRGVLIYEDDTLRIAFNRVEADCVVFNVENLTGEAVRIRPDSLAINSENLDGLGIFDFRYIPAMSVCEARYECKLGADTEVGTISGHIIGYGPENSDSKIHIDFTFDGVVDESLAPAEEKGGVLMYEDDMMRVYYKGVTGDGVILQVSNLTDFSQNFIVDCLAVNRHNYNDLLCVAQIAPHSNGKVTVKCDWDPEESVGEISGYFRSQYDGDNRPDAVRFTIDSFVVDSSVKVADVQPEGTLLYEDMNVKISFKEFDGNYVIFDVQNFDSKAIAIQSGLLIINDTEYKDSQIVMSSEIAPHSTGLAKAKMTLKDDSVQKISGEISVVNILVFNSYPAEIQETIIE